MLWWSWRSLQYGLTSLMPLYYKLTEIMRIPGSEWAEGKLENKKLNKQKSLENENRKVVNTKTNP